MKEKIIVVVGADGYVGKSLADDLLAKKVVYRNPINDEINIENSNNIISKADIIINAAGFRVKPGLSFNDYRHSHLEATSKLISLIKKDCVFIHISSASVLGKSTNKILDDNHIPDPKSFPCSNYAQTKLETDVWLQKRSTEKEFKLFIIRPSVLYSSGGEGMLNSLLKLAKKRIILRLFPRKTRHHLCEMKLFIKTINRIIKNHNQLSQQIFIIANPYTITNIQIEKEIKKNKTRSSIILPLPLGLISFFLRIKFFSKILKFDFITWGEILDIMNLDTVYDASSTFKLLDIKTSDYSKENTFSKLIKETMNK